MYDQVRIYFDDGTETVIYVHEDEDIVDAVAVASDEVGAEVCDFTIEDRIYE